MEILRSLFGLAFDWLIDCPVDWLIDWLSEHFASFRSYRIPTRSCTRIFPSRFPSDGSKRLRRPSSRWSIKKRTSWSRRRRARSVRSSTIRTKSRPTVSCTATSNAWRGTGSRISGKRDTLNCSPTGWNYTRTTEKQRQGLFTQRTRIFC